MRHPTGACTIGVEGEAVFAHIDTADAPTRAAIAAEAARAAYPGVSVSTEPDSRRPGLRLVIGVPTTGVRPGATEYRRRVRAVHAAVGRAIGVP